MHIKPQDSVSKLKRNLSLLFSVELLCASSNSEVIIRFIAYNNNQGSEVFGQRSMSWEKFKITAAMRY